LLSVSYCAATTGAWRGWRPAATSTPRAAAASAYPARTIPCHSSHAGGMTYAYQGGEVAGEMSPGRQGDTRTTRRGFTRA